MLITKAVPGVRPVLAAPRYQTATSCKKRVLQTPPTLRPSVAGTYFFTRRLQCAASASQTVVSLSPAPPNPYVKFFKWFWTFTGFIAILGSIGGALAALMGWFQTSYALALPLVLPIVFLFSALQREGLIAEVSINPQHDRLACSWAAVDVMLSQDNKYQLNQLSAAIGRDVQSLLAQTRASIEEARHEMAMAASSTSKLGTIESRLSSLEGSILSAGNGTLQPETVHISMVLCLCTVATHVQPVMHTEDAQMAWWPSDLLSCCLRTPYHSCDRRAPFHQLF